MNQVQVEQKSYQMPPQEGFSVAHFLTVADLAAPIRHHVLREPLIVNAIGSRLVICKLPLLMEIGRPLQRRAANRLVGV